MKNLIFAFSVLFSANLFAAKKPQLPAVIHLPGPVDACKDRLVSKPKRGTLSNPKLPGAGQIAREMGIEFLIVRVSYDRLVAMVEGAREGDVQIFAGGAGIVSPRSGIRDVGERFDHSMAPLMRQHKGKWAHQLIGNGGDIIGMGVRSKMVDQWKVGLIFPVEILDYFDFVITSSRTVDDRIKAMTFGRSKDLFDSTKDGLEKFREVAGWQVNNEPHPQSTDVNSYWHIHFNEPIPAWTMSMLWIPAPLADHHSSPRTRSQIPGVDSKMMPPKGKAFSTRIAYQTPNIGRGWTDVIPPQEDTMEFFAPEDSLGTWFNTIPDWALVSSILNQQPKRARPFLPPPERNRLK